MPEPTSVNFPASMDSSVTLGGDMRNLVELTLDASINAATGTISVSEDITGINVPCPMLIGSELIWLTEKSGGDFINSVRGTESTTAASHTNGDPAYLVYSANLFNQLKRGIIAIEEYLIGSASQLTVASDVLTVTSSRHTIQPETGTSDNIATISGLPDKASVLLTAADPGTDTLTFKHGTGNLSCASGADTNLSHGMIMAFRLGSTVYILGGSGGAAGDVTGPASSTGDNIALFNGITGKLLKDGGKGVPTGAILGTTDTQTLTNKRITRRVTTITSSATPTVNTDNCDVVSITAQAAAITSMTTNLSGTPTDFQTLVYRIKDNGTARAITWGASFEAKGVALPTTTVISKVLTVGFIYDTVTSKWGCVASAQEA